LYAAGLLHPTREESRKAGIPTDSATKAVAGKVSGGVEETMLLRAWNGKLLAERLQLPELELEIERAVEQVEKAVEDGRKAQADGHDSAQQKTVKTEDVEPKR